MRHLLFLLPLICSAAVVPLDISGVRPGPVSVEGSSTTAVVKWKDANAREWRAEFSLDQTKPLIHSVGVSGKVLLSQAQPVYRCAVGIRRKGWDEFFDLPPSHPDGTRQFVGEFRPEAARAKTIGNRVELTFDGFRMGIFQGALTFTFYPGSRLIHQQAVVTTSQPDVAYYYDTGLRMADDAAVRPGRNMEASVFYYDTEGKFQKKLMSGPERQPQAVRYRTIAARAGAGSIAVFPAPHQYFFARDYTTNMAYTWHTAWRGFVSIGIRQLADDNTPFYPWNNAPPGTEQRMGVFYLLDDREPEAVLSDVLKYTNRDRFQALDGYKVMAAHWHFAYTDQALVKGFDWVPPFKPVLKDMGVDAAMIADFHGDGHPRDLTDLRLRELKAYYDACRAQSDAGFLLFPSEEANVHLGGHWSVIFPKPVYWMMDRPAGTEFLTKDPKYGAVYRVGNQKEMLELIRLEGGWAYQTHPRTKGSRDYPDKIRETEHFRDSRYFGVGWKAMPSDLSSPRLGERSLKLLDDMNNWGLKKFLIGEADVFQIDHTHELYAHMNVNYVRLPRLPDFDNYRDVMSAVSRGDFFISTGEVLLPESRIRAGDGGGIVVRTKVKHTFPLQMAEVVWGDGAQVHRKTIPLTETGEFGTKEFEWTVDAKGWKWARVAVWDIAANGAFINPVWK